MSAEENKAIIRRLYEEGYNQRRTDIIDELYAADYVNHSPLPGEAPDRAGTKRALTQGLAAFPDSRFTIEEMIAEGDRVVTRWSSRGTHLGEFTGIPATGKPTNTNAISI